MLQVQASVFEMAKFRDDIRSYVQQFGVSDINSFFEKRLESWQDIKVNITITGFGKSSFVNRIYTGVSMLKSLCVNSLNVDQSTLEDSDSLNATNLFRVSKDEL